MKTLVIFDIDGTLLYSNKVDSQCFADAYERYFGRAFPSIDWRDYPHVTDHTIFSHVYSDHFGGVCTAEDRLTFEEVYIGLMQERREEDASRFREVPRARSTVEQLLAHDDYVVGIATGGWRRPALFKLDHLNIPTDGIHAGYADDMETREDILQTSIDSAQAAHDDIEKTVYVGDAIWDVKTTRRMGLPLIGVRHAGDEHVLRTHGVQHVISDYGDFSDFCELIAQASPC